MFTGLVQALGTVCELREEGSGRLLVITAPATFDKLPLGASVAVNGVCLTVVAVEGNSLHFQVGPETLRLTNLGKVQPGDRINLEQPLRLSDPLGGHIVQGHVDGVGAIASRQMLGEWEMIRIRCPPELARQMIPRGSIAVDGVSLTLVDVDEDSFSVALIPHTLAVTTLGFKQPGDTVNLETDLFGKYVWKYLEGML